MKHVIPLVLLAIPLAGCPVLSVRDEKLRQDSDGDGWDAVEYGGLDCNDFDPDVNPLAVERCDSVDNDCDGQANAEDDTVVDADWYLDGDGDGAGDPLVHERTCARLGGDDLVQPWVRNSDDCDDQDPEAHPGQTWLLDGDGDGFGTPTRVLVQCERPPAFVALPDKVSLDDCPNDCDCDDQNREIRPGAKEVCNGEDNDCDGLPASDDPDLAGGNWFPDSDHDGFGDLYGVATPCNDLGDRVNDNSDCRDDEQTIFPGAREIPYNDLDENCNPYDDDDADQDGFDDERQGGTDCDDANPLVNPTAVELCSGISEGCAPGFVPSDDNGLATFYPGRYDREGGAVGGAGAGGLPADLPEPSPVFAPLDYTSVLTTGDTAFLNAGGTLYLCGDDTTPAFWGGVVGGYGEVDIRGVTFRSGAEMVPSRVTIDLQGTGAAIDLSGGELSDLEIENGSRQYQPGCLVSFGTTTLRSVTFTNCAGYADVYDNQGAGVLLYQLREFSTGALSDVRVRNGTGPVALQLVGDFDVEDLTVTDTVGGVGVFAGSASYAPAELRLVDSTVTDNELGGVVVADGTLVLDGSVVSDNGEFGAAATYVSLTGASRVNENTVGVVADHVTCSEGSITRNDIGVAAAASVTAEAACSFGEDGRGEDNVVDLTFDTVDYVDVTTPITCDLGSGCTP